MESKEVKGRVILNRNICDNAPECSGIEVCPTGALYWDEENERIEYNEDICLNCGVCAESCPVEAILFGEDEDDYWKKRADVENDTRRIEELVVERFGATPIEPPLDYTAINDFVSIANTDTIVLEFFSDDSIDCLLHSIRAEEIMSWFPEKVTYKKVRVTEEDDITLYNIIDLPALVVFRNKSFIGSVNGRYNDSEESKAALKEKMAEFSNL